ncbi:MAG: VWA domain-containing protein [Hyphomicrobium sp.]|uniref:vWA domain-containing protein n=1 Tax=Hyphomicrobium sp. TaxID=82 RepID=UPI0039E5A1FD
MLKIMFGAAAAVAMFVGQQASPTADKAPCTSDAMIVFDASGSMSASDFPDGVSTRISRVRSALAKFLPQVSSTRNLGLVIYGPGQNADECENVSVRFGPMADAGSKIEAEVDRLVPAGRTPLTNAVRDAADALGAADKPGAIVLLTDGEETCGGSPCNLARELAARRPNTIVHVIGYKLQSLDGSAPVSGAKCLSEKTGGLYLTAETVGDLVRALQKMLGCNQLSSVERLGAHIAKKRS